MGKLKKIELSKLQDAFRDQPRARVSLEVCPSSCPDLGNKNKKCTPDNCGYLQKKYAHLINKSIADAEKKQYKLDHPELEDEEEKPRIVGIKSRERRLLFQGEHGDIPILDTIDRDQEVWCLPFKDGKDYWVSHRITIFGVRGDRRHRLAVVEVYVPTWEKKHHRCKEHKVKHKKVKVWKCHICGRTPTIRWRRQTRKCKSCNEVIGIKSDAFEWNWICPACENKEDAQRLAWDWFRKEKLPSSGYNVVYLPYTSYEFRTVELTRKNSKSIGRFWK